MEITAIQKILIYALPVIFAITVHEAAHGYVARHFGDPTAERAGRITLNPLSHIDPIGTLLVPALAMMFGGVLFGWAKPVPVEFGRLRKPKRDMIWVAAAGPAANFGMILAWALVMRLANTNPGGYLTEPLALMAWAGITTNTVLMVLNLIPLPPLDGGRIAVGLLPMPYAGHLARVEPFGFLILLALLLTHVLDRIIGPFIGFVLMFVSKLFGV